MLTDTSKPALTTRGGRGRMEVRLVVFGVVGVLVAAALYVLVFGSPNHERRAIDSPNTDPFRAAPAAPAAPERPAERAGQPSS